MNLRNTSRYIFMIWSCSHAGNLNWAERARFPALSCEVTVDFYWHATTTMIKLGESPWDFFQLINRITNRKFEGNVTPWNGFLTGMRDFRASAISRSLRSKQWTSNQYLRKRYQLSYLTTRFPINIYNNDKIGVQAICKRIYLLP